MNVWLRIWKFFIKNTPFCNESQIFVMKSVSFWHKKAQICYLKDVVCHTNTSFIFVACQWLSAVCQKKKKKSLATNQSFVNNLKIIHLKSKALLEKSNKAQEKALNSQLNVVKRWKSFSKKCPIWSQKVVCDRKFEYSVRKVIYIYLKDFFLL